MIRNVGAIAVVALVGFVAIRVLFGIAGGIVGVALSLAWLLLKVLLVVGLIYWVLSVFSPDTARKMKDSMRGDSL